MSLFCSKSRVLLSTLTPPGRANSHFSLSCCSYVTAMTWFLMPTWREMTVKVNPLIPAAFYPHPTSSWWWSSELWFVTRVTFHLSLRLRHVHRLSHLSADDPDMWDGHIWCIQGKWVCQEFTVPKKRPCCHEGVCVCSSCVLPGSSLFSAIKYLTLLSTPWWPWASWFTPTPSRITCSSW